MLKNATDELTNERNMLSESKTKNEVREKELLFLIQSLEDQLEFQKQRSNVDMSLIDVAMKSEFQKRYLCVEIQGIFNLVFRLNSELKKLRKKYERETEKSKTEFMNIHSKKVQLLLY